MISSLLVSYFLSDFAPQSQYVNTSTVARNSSTVTITELEQRALQTTPAGAQRIKMLSLDLEASCDDNVRVHSVPVRHIGLGRNEDISALYLMENGMRISSVQAINSRDGRVSLSLRNFVIPSCQERTVDIFADFSDSAAIAGQHRIALGALQDVDVDQASVVINNDTQKQVNKVIASDISNSSLRDSSDVLSVRYLSIPGRIKTGGSRTVGKFRLSANGDSSHLLRRITLKNNGSAQNRDLQNIYLTDSRGNIVSSVLHRMNGDYISMRFLPNVTIEKGKNKAFIVKADVVGGIRKTVQLAIEEPSDIDSVASSRSFR